MNDEMMNKLKAAVQKQTDGFDPNAEEQDESLEFHETETVDLGTLYGRFATTSNSIMLWVGMFWAFGFGAAMPGFCFFFGELIDDMGT